MSTLIGESLAVVRVITGSRAKAKVSNKVRGRDILVSQWAKLTVRSSF